jgi:hypothetical protein
LFSLFFLQLLSYFSSYPYFPIPRSLYSSLPTFPSSSSSSNCFNYPYPTYFILHVPGHECCAFGRQLRRLKWSITKSF